jgi:hypothetical protein
MHTSILLCAKDHKEGTFSVFLHIQGKEPKVILHKDKYDSEGTFSIFLQIALSTENTFSVFLHIGKYN